jgi:hypothetical protein
MTRTQAIALITENIEDDTGAPFEGARLAMMIDDLAALATPDVIPAYKRLGGAR